ncbi:MAG: sensor histidine kinase [Flavobacteriales bacterium]
MTRKNVLISLVHTGYWLMYGLLFFSFFVMLFASGRREFDEFWPTAREFGISMIPFSIVTGIVGFYSAYIVGFSLGFLKKKWLRFIGWYSLTNVLGVLLAYATYFLLYEGFSIYWSWETLFAQALLMAFIITINFVIGIVVKGFIHSFEEMRIREELHRRTTKVELELVKAHLQPHFLFNTINNIDSMLVKSPEQASSYLNKLSDILRYSLFESDKDKVSLKSEVEYLHRYLELQAIRTHIKDYAVMNVTGDVEAVEVAPFVFMPFVENAFKHSARVSQRGAIQINLEVMNNDIIFSCINKLDDRGVEKSEASGGIGNDLIRKRLELVYGDHHTLSLQQTDSEYQVYLRIRCVNTLA